MKTAVRLPIAIIFSETEVLRQEGGIPKRWTQPRSTVSLLEKPTLRRLQQKRMNITAPSRAIPAIAADRTNIPWGIMKFLDMAFRRIKISRFCGWYIESSDFQHCFCEQAEI